MEMELLYRLSMAVGFLIAAVLFIILIGAIAGAVLLTRNTCRELDRAIDALVRQEVPNESEP